MDEINQLLSTDVQAVILQILVGAGVLLPFLEWLAGKTANTWDDKVVGKIAATLQVLMRFFPRASIKGK
jgi:hypothetical protein